MPKDVVPDEQVPKKRSVIPARKASVITHEATAYIDAVFAAFSENAKRWSDLVGNEREVQARLELAEKTLCLTRDHLTDSIKQAGCAATPTDWEPLFHRYRFVGVRLVDACLTVLSEKKKLTSEEMLLELNSGQFRFRTTSPLREIHAALLRQKRAKKLGDVYVWIGGGGAIDMRPREVTTTNTAEEQATGTESK